MIQQYYGSLIEKHLVLLWKKLLLKKDRNSSSTYLTKNFSFLENWELLKEIKDPYDKLKMSDALFEK